MHTTIDGMPLVGSKGYLASKDGDIRVQVAILSTREVWGRVQYLVAPIAGTGQAWVSEDRVRL